MVVGSRRVVGRYIAAAAVTRGRHATRSYVLETCKEREELDNVERKHNAERGWRRVDDDGHWPGLDGQ